MGGGGGGVGLCGPNYSCIGPAAGRSRRGRETILNVRYKNITIICVYIYIYREREMHTCIHIYIYTYDKRIHVGGRIMVLTRGDGTPHSRPC